MQGSLSVARHQRPCGAVHRAERLSNRLSRKQYRNHASWMSQCVFLRCPDAPNSPTGPSKPRGLRSPDPSRGFGPRVASGWNQTINAWMICPLTLRKRVPSPVFLLVRSFWSIGSLFLGSGSWLTKQARRDKHEKLARRVLGAWKSQQC